MKELADELFSSLTLFGMPTFYLVLIIFLSQTVGPESFVKALGLLLLVEVAGLAIKLLYKKERPVIMKRITLLQNYLASSFPSIHTARMVCLAVILSFLFPSNRPIQIVFWLLALGVGYSRIYLKKHDTIDVLGGFALGIGVGLLWNFL